MSKKILVVIALFILIPICFYVFGKTGPIASVLSHRILLNNQLFLNELGIGSYDGFCYYTPPATLMGTSNPSLQCVNEKTYTRDEVRSVLLSAEKILIERGWQASASNRSGQELVYNKGDLDLMMEEYYWSSKATKDRSPLLTVLSRTTLWKP